jgi:hypothetical protein
VFTYDLALAAVGTVLVARPLLHWLDRVHPSPLWSRFGGLEHRTARSLPMVLLSAAIGALSHVLLDLPFHDDHPLLSPAPDLHVFPAEYAWSIDRVSDALYRSLLLLLLHFYWWRPAHPRQTVK